MKDKIIVKPYEEIYHKRVVNLITSIQQKEFGIPIKYEDQPDLYDIVKSYRQNAGEFWVALDEDRLVGTIALGDIGNKQGVLRKMFVDADYRGKQFGAALKLLVALEIHSAENYIEEIYLGTVSVLHAAHRFYEKNHYQEINKESLPKTFPLVKVDTKFYFKKM